MVQKPTCSLFSGDQNFGIIYQEQQHLIKKVYGVAVALTSSEERADFGGGGVTRLITVQGVHDGNGFAGVTQNQKLDTFIFTIEEWFNKGIQTAITYTNSFGVDFKVRGLEFKWQRMRNDPFRIAYTLVLREGI